MSNESSTSEKSEQATPKKQRDARERGQVAQSKDLTMSVAIVTLIVMLVINYHSFTKSLADNYLVMFDIIKNKYDLKVLMPQIWQLITEATKVLFFPIIVAALTSLVVNLIQIGGIVFSFEVFKLDLNKFNPVKNFKQIFSQKNLVKFIKNVFEIIVLTVVAVILIKNEFADIMLLTNYSFENIISFLSYLFLKIFIALLFCYFIFAIIDLYWEKFQLSKELRMTKDEVKKEYKETEGDPEIKARRREMHQEIVNEGDMFSTLKDATLILANPTHIAIVILYSPKRWPLPIVLYKAEDKIAEAIFNVAKRNKILLIRDKWLARNLFNYAEVGKYVPASMLEHVATIINKNLHLLPNLIAELQAVRTLGTNSTI